MRSAVGVSTRRAFSVSLAAKAVPTRCHAVSRQLVAWHPRNRRNDHLGRSITCPAAADDKRPFTTPPPKTAIVGGGFPSSFALKLAAGLAAGGILLALATAAGFVVINSLSTTPCQLTPEGCEQIPLFMKVPLIATHLFTFLLVPATMYVFYTRASALRGAGAQDPFVALVGLSYLMVAIAGEIGWHVTQDWFYKEDYSILNFFFYLFLISGTSLWAIGIKEDDTTTDIDEKIDVALLASPLVAGLVYALGAAVTDTKVPIYIILSFQYAILTYRFWNLLKTPKVLLFPFFSVGVNLTFIALLNAHKDDHILNPLFHILHDAAGTLMGVAIISILVYQELPADAAAAIGEAPPAVPAKDARR